MEGMTPQEAAAAVVVSAGVDKAKDSKSWKKKKTAKLEKKNASAEKAQKKKAAHARVPKRAARAVVEEDVGPVSTEETKHGTRRSHRDDPWQEDCRANGTEEAGDDVEQGRLHKPEGALEAHAEG